ncbi:hypothetical protein ACLSSQ_00265 [Azospira sp. APE16]|jgi:hypothetical protein|uniref:hypothetical protein n=1 Tax=Azospira sp. APE16 TaxID=3394231 RepID=UPI003A4E1BDF
MKPGIAVRVTGHRPGREQIAHLQDRTGVICDASAFKLLPGFVAVALNYRDGTPQGKRPNLTLFHQDELEVLAPQTVTE